GFFSTEIEEEEKGTPLKRGRGSQKKTKGLVMAESHPIEGQTNFRSPLNNILGLCYLYKLTIFNYKHRDLVNQLIRQSQFATMVYIVSIAFLFSQRGV
ncbi:hypothetical protein EZS27_029282, partial [termite gut metagenome]